MVFNGEMQKGEKGEIRTHQTASCYILELVMLFQTDNQDDTPYLFIYLITHWIKIAYWEEKVLQGG